MGESPQTPEGAAFNARRARGKRPLPWWVDAFQRDTQHLEADEIGAYMLILGAMWTRESCDFPDDDRRLAAVSRVSIRLWKSRLGPALRPFFRSEAGVLVSKRLCEEAVFVEHHLEEQSRRKRGTGGGGDAPAGAENAGLTRSQSAGDARPGKDAEKSAKALRSNGTASSVDDPRKQPRNQPRHHPTQQPNNLREASATAAASRPQQPLGGLDDPGSWTDDRLWQEVVAAVGLQNGPLPTHWQPPSAILHVGRWRSEHGLSAQRIVDAARQSRAHHQEPPKGPKALDGVMQRVAEQLRGTPSSPAQAPESLDETRARWDRLTAGYDDEPMAAAAGRG